MPLGGGASTSKAPCNISPISKVVGLWKKGEAVSCNEKGPHLLVNKNENVILVVAKGREGVNMYM